jgi:diguanylate cyclase (GGDEF)-like protein/PAS domain S-box-containing protein
MPAQPQTLLIVDDIPENLVVIGNLLRTDYLIRVAGSGARALQVVVLDPMPDLILLDVMMPEMDGYEVLRHLRENPATRDIPVIFLTALNNPDDVARGLQQGAVDYITKPIQPAVVLARVRTQLEARRAREWLKDQNAFLEEEIARRMAENRRIQDAAERAQAILNHQRELILASAAEGIFGVDTDGIINFVNPAAAGLLGYERNELLGGEARQLFNEWVAGGSGKPDADCPIRASCAVGVAIRSREELFRSKDGTVVALEFSCTPITEDGRRAGAVVTLQDQSERKRYLEQLERKSNYDDLTGLPNRNLLNDRLAHAIERCRKDGSTLAVLVLNLDRFKAINDSLGHEAGDRVLREVGGRLGGQIRRSDTLARSESDEFVLVADAMENEVVPQFAQPLLELLTPPFVAGEREFFLTGSIGIAMFPKDGEDGESLLRNAGAAMYQAKAVGGARYHFYTAEMNARSLERLDMENGLRRALDRKEMVIYYQPQLSLRTGEIIGAEALLRWQHPQRGLVMPGEFIGLAEDSGLIVPLGEWVLQTACEQNKAWQDAGLPPLTVAVNMSARQFTVQDVVKMAAAIIERTGLEAHYLELELTESTVMADTEAFIQATEQLHGLAITLSIDDFGTGFSSLNYLKRFAIDRLKIDQSFVRDLTHDANSAAIARAIISLAHSLKLSVIAEGVESEAQLNFLRRRDCDEMQGFYFSRPVTAVEFEQMLRERRKLEFATTESLPGRTLLLVDDEPGILSALKRLFRREGYTLLTAQSGAEALELLACQAVGVIISDARMPGMSGGELLGKVREMYPDSIRMMLSGYTDLKSVTSAVNRGELFCFLTKPWDDKELVDTVRDAFHQYKVRHHGRH